MGEAKRHQRFRDSMHKYCIPMSRHRFNLFAIGTRRSTLYHIFEELSWWSSPDERLIAAVGRDEIDKDFSWAILARDELGRFRAVKVNCSYTSLSRAEQAMWQIMRDTILTDDIAELGRQGEKTNVQIDLLHIPTDAEPSSLHPYFKILLDTKAREPARAVIREIGPWLAPKDPHLVQEFQRKGFDQRLWEIYLWAALREFGLDVEQLEAPDFRCRAPSVDFTIEATTAAPSTMGPLAQHPNPKTPIERMEFLKDFMPMKYGSALTSKLNKTNSSGLHYWEREESKSKPFLLAIADFHRPADEEGAGSMTYTRAAIWQYLYGQRCDWHFEGEHLVISTVKIENHSYGGKTIPSGFFDLPLACNISAVLFSNAGTLAKFDRIGVVAGFAVPSIRYIRFGVRVNPDPNAMSGIPFSVDVGSPSYEEFWTDEIQVFHNPNALYPLPLNALTGATHHFVKDGELRTFGPTDAILSSYTVILQEVDADEDKVGPPELTEIKEG